jgi:indolepyruvate ferredoxin oxidoreductase, alpha subunit
MKLIRRVLRFDRGQIHVIEDGYRYLQELLEVAGYPVSGKGPYSPLTEWTPRWLRLNWV